MLFAYCTICKYKSYKYTRTIQNISLNKILLYFARTSLITWMSSMHYRCNRNHFRYNFKNNAIIVFTDIRTITNIINLPCWRMQSYSKYIVILLGFTKIWFVDLLSFSWFRELSWNIFRLIKKQGKWISS